MSVERISFGSMPDGTVIHKYVITNSRNCSVHILTLGATLAGIYAADKNGQLRDVLLGFDTVPEYLEKSDYQGACVGPVCNRLGGAGFNIGGRRYALSANENGTTCLHSCGEFSFALWKALITDSDSVELSYVSPDGKNGFPGEVTAKVTYTLDESNALHIAYDAVSSRDTFLNLTNHAYFNLNGFASGDILSHILTLDSAFFTEVDALSIPTGNILSVENTPMDFRQPKKIGKDIDADYPQLLLTGGYDHNYCIDNPNGALKKIASVFAEESGIKMNVYTTLPGVQFYAGNFLKGTPGKKGEPMNRRSGFCLETQFYPDSPNRQEFPQCLFKAGEHCISETVYEFSI